MIVVARSPKDIDRERRIERLRLEGTAARCSMEERQAQLAVMAKRTQRRRVVGKGDLPARRRLPARVMPKTGVCAV
jgi:hypothetical protein